MTPKETPDHMFGLVTEIHTVPETDTWYNLTFNPLLSDAYDLTFENNNTVIIDCDGHYTITLGGGFLDDSPSPNSHNAFRIVSNGIEIPGSYIEIDVVDRRNEDVWIEHTTHTELTDGDELQMQYISSDTDVTVEQHDTYTTQGFHAFGYIQEVT